MIPLRLPWRHRAPSTRSDQGDDPLAIVLERYARETLDADPAVLADLRTQLLERVVRLTQAAASEHERVPARKPGAVLESPRRWALHPVSVRRAGAVALAGVLLLGGAGAAVATSGPGGPLYPTRLELETLGLPPAGSAAWFAAEAGRLDARLREAERAAQANDTPAVEAALGAYRGILAQTVAQADDAAPGSVPPGLTHALDRHAALLSALLARVPAQARPALRAALGQLERAVAAAGSPAPTEQPGLGAGHNGAPATAAPGRAGVAPGHQRTHPPANGAPPPAAQPPAAQPLATQPPKGHGGANAAPTGNGRPASSVAGNREMYGTGARNGRGLSSFQ